MAQILEKHIQDKILRYLQWSGIFAWVNKTQGTWDAKRGQFRKNVTKKGVSDILGVLPDGRFLAIEVKRKPNRPTPEQEQFILDVNRNGGLAFVAYSIEDVKKHLPQFPTQERP